MELDLNILRPQERISLQVRLLYEKAGFVQTSQEFLEDGIPHIRMVWNKP